MSGRWQIRPTTRRTSKTDMVDIYDADGHIIAVYVHRADALRMIHDPAQVANDAIAAFLEAKDRGLSDTEAWSEAVSEIVEGCAFDEEAFHRERAAERQDDRSWELTQDLEALPF